MPPRKRDKDSEVGGIMRGPRIDPQQADHELFLQAFEKPTQIYRFLRTRNLLSPIFLNRTLSYMKRRMSRSNKSRIGFKIDSLLEKVTLKRSNELQPNTLGGYMTLTFLGFYDKGLENPRDFQVKVETLLLKICHKKRKESSSAIVEVSVGTCSVPLNPSSSEPPSMASAVSISSDTFSPSAGPNVKSYMLLLRVAVSPASPAAASAPATGPLEITNGEPEEPVNKRPKPSMEDTKCAKLYGSELIVYDKHNRCLLTNGEYDLVMHDAAAAAAAAAANTLTKSPHKALAAQWESIQPDTDIQSETNPFDIFKVRPILKLKLSWSQAPADGLVNRPPLYEESESRAAAASSAAAAAAAQAPSAESTGTTSALARCSNVISRALVTVAGGAGRKGETEAEPDGDGERRHQIVIYQFLYNNNSRQQTEACDDLHCPWCSLDCGTLYSLLKHLKLCHERFNFVYFPIAGGARIDVSINELYDGSYTGSPHDLIAAQGRGAAPGPRAGPTRRTALTNILVCRPKRRHRRERRDHKQSLSEFLELDDNEVMESQRPYITGHNRLYHHTITCLPVYPKELELDSEGETDPLWLQQKTMMMIDEFTDVNEGEKELMKMWNLHVMKYNFVGDCQIPLACQTFLQSRGKELLEKNLYRNFILHMCSLHDFSLISPVAVYQTIQLLNQMLADNDEAKERMRLSLKAQQEHWNAVGKFQQPTVIELPNGAVKPNNFNVEASPSVRRKTSNLQNANRMGTASFNMQPGTSSEPKRKLSSGSVQSRKRSSISERKSSI